MTNAVLQEPVPPVAMQQKQSPEATDLAELAPDELHERTVSARGVLCGRWSAVESETRDKFLPLCAEIIRRYRQPGVTGKFRLNNKPTVEQYFRSINLSYDTVRSWICRKRRRNNVLGNPFQRDRDKTRRRGDTDEAPEAQLSIMEARLLAGAEDALDLAHLLRDSNLTLPPPVEEALVNVEQRYTRQRIEKYRERKAAEYDPRVGGIVVVGNQHFEIVDEPVIHEGPEGRVVLEIIVKPVLLTAEVDSDMEKANGGPEELTTLMAEQQDDPVGAEDAEDPK